MASCINTNSPEWKDLVDVVGKFEAARDYLENDKIRTPKEVLDKLEKRRAAEAQDSFVRPLAPVEPEGLSDMANDMLAEPQQTTELTVDQFKNTRAVEFANKLSASLKLNYEVVTIDEARAITEKSKNPWNGEAAFFLADKIYFIKGRMSSDMVVHEFAHPFVRTLITSNPRLFYTLFNEAALTKEGKEVIADVKKLYPEFNFEELNLNDANVLSDLFKEEVVVRLLEKKALASISEERVTPEFKNVIDKIMYQIKQMLRKVFGKTIKVSKLEPNTSLDELADILTKGDKIEIDTQIPAAKDIIAYNRDARAEIKDDLDTVKDKDILNTVTQFHDMISDHIIELMHKEEYEELAELLMDDAERSDLRQIKANLGQYKAGIRESAK